MVDEEVEGEVKDIEDVRRMTIRGAIPPTEERLKRQEAAARRLKKKEEEDEEKGEGEIEKEKPECFWPSREQPVAKLSSEELADALFALKEEVS